MTRLARLAKAGIRPEPIRVVLLVALCAACGPSAPLNTLEDAIREARTGPDAPAATTIVERDVQGDWAYVRTEGAGRVGHAQLVVIETPQGRTWAPLSLAEFDVHRGTLHAAALFTGGAAARGRQGGLDPKLEALARSKWTAYLQSSRRTVYEPPDPVQVAEAMVAVLLPKGWKGTFGNFTSTRAEDLAETLKLWRPPLEKATGASDFAFGLMTYLPGVRSLYADGRFQPARARELGARIGGIPPQAINEWQATMKTVAGASPDRVNAVLQMIQVDGVWNGATFVREGHDIAIARLGTIPPASVTAWSRVSGDRDMVALSLLQVDPLFVRDRFDAGLFDRAVKEAAPRYEKAAQTLK